MRKILKNNAHTKKYLQTLPKIYLIACWAGYGIRSFPYAGHSDTDGIPYVWDYYDCNGVCDEWRITKLSHTTSGHIYAWTTAEREALYLADVANRASQKSSTQEGS